MFNMFYMCVYVLFALYVYILKPYVVYISYVLYVLYCSMLTISLYVLYVYIYMFYLLYMCYICTCVLFVVYVLHVYICTHNSSCDAKYLYRWICVYSVPTCIFSETVTSINISLQRRLVFSSIYRRNLPFFPLRDLLTCIHKQ